MPPRITQSAIAQHAGVHRTTVSLSLSNSPAIPLATRQRIQALATEMGYQPDPVLQALMVYRSEKLPHRPALTLAYVTNWSSRWGWRAAHAHHAFFEGASRRAQALGYKLDHFWLGERGQSQQRLGDILHHRGIKGVILASCMPDREPAIDLGWDRFSAVKIDSYPPEPALHVITNDQRLIIQLAVRQMRLAGYRRIGFVLPHRWDEFSDGAWSAGFLAEQFRWPRAEQLPIYCEDPTAAASKRRGKPDTDAFAAWFKRHEPDAIIGYGEFILPQLAKLRLRIPRDVAFADMFVLKADGRTAGVLQNSAHVGEVAINVLAAQLIHHDLGVPSVATSTLVEGRWVDGASLPHKTPAP